MQGIVVQLNFTRLQTRGVVNTICILSCTPDTKYIVAKVQVGIRQRRDQWIYQHLRERLNQRRWLLSKDICEKDFCARPISIHSAQERS